MTDGRHPLVEELERRIHEIEHQADEHFGGFDSRDWLLTTLIGIIIPVLLLLWFWP